jgi:hypothetical protein
MLAELGQAAWAHTTHALDVLAYAPSPDPAPKEINTDGILTFIASKIAPILLAVLGIVFIGRAQKGEISRVLTSSAIAIVGAAFIAGGATLFLFGGSLMKLVIK